jgi:Spy/CpxP family protein refolding chaperone
MKTTMKMFLAAALFLMMGLSVNAQSRKAPDRSENRPDKETADLVKELDLSDKQAAQVKKIHQDFGEKMEKARKNNDGDREDMREHMAKMEKEKNAEMKTVLSKEQYKKYEELHAEKRKQAKGKAPSGERRTRTGTRP